MLNWMLKLPEPSDLDIAAHTQDTSLPPTSKTALDNVTLTCHNGGGAIETNHGFERLEMENIESFLLKGKPLTPVNAHLFKKE